VRILYFTQYYPPEVGATQTRAHEMSAYLTQQGHHVTIITEVPNHPSGIVPPAYRGRLSERKLENSIDVLRLWVWASPEKTFKSRMRFYLSYMGMAALAGALIRGKYDLVYATSPPLFVGAAGLASATVRRIPFVFEVRDLWPESAVALAELSGKRAIKAAEALEGLLYRRAALVVAVTQGIYDRLSERRVGCDKLALVPNGANTEHFHFSTEERAAVRTQLGLQDKFVVMYAGIHGIAQGLETLLQAAALLQNSPDIRFVFVGEGPRKAALAQRLSDLNLHNVTMLPEVPSSKMPSYLSAADCTIVPLRDELLFRGALPSKMFESWAAERPIVLSVAGEAQRVLEQANAGIACRPEDPADMARAIRTLHYDPVAAQEMGKRGRAYVLSHYSRRAQAQTLEQLLKTVTQQPDT
jgi:colanic acid biosynthesis glycosyl transferase WcaI